MWLYETDVGVFWIRFSPRGRGRFLLGIGDEELGAYLSPEAAVDDVYLQKSGWPEWDLHPQSRKPEDLSQWTRRDCRA